VIDVEEWSALRRVVASAFRSSLHVSIASVGAGGAPVVTPIGSFFLDEPGRAHYLELYATGLGRRLEADPRVSVLAVDSGRLLWLRALAGGRFARRPAIRLTCTAVAGAPPATADQIARFSRRVGLVWRLPGSRLLWGGDARIRELRVERIEGVNLGRLSRGRAR
jgi:hypothetical protein